MPAYWWSAEAFNVNDVPPQWVASTNMTGTVIQNDTNGNYLTGVGLTESTRQFMTFLPPGNPTDFEIYITTVMADDAAVFGRGKDTNDITAVSAVRGDIRASGSRGRALSRFLDGSFLILEDATAFGAATAIKHIRFRVSGGTLQGKWWLLGDPEPANFLLTTTVSDTDLLTAGSLGVFQFSGDIRVYNFGVGTDGEEAPTGPLTLRAKLMLTHR